MRDFVRRASPSASTDASTWASFGWRCGTCDASGRGGQGSFVCVIGREGLEASGTGRDQVSAAPAAAPDASCVLGIRRAHRVGARKFAWMIMPWRRRMWRNCTIDGQRLVVEKTSIITVFSCHCRSGRIPRVVRVRNSI
jgi:hypothetical protein